jgi:hypothetical protein
MSRFISMATIHFQVSTPGKDSQHTVLSQFREAESRLDGTGVDLVVTCEGMEAVGQTVKQSESADNPGSMFTAYRDFAMRNKCTIAGSIKLEDGGKVYNALAFKEADRIPIDLGGSPGASGIHVIAYHNLKKYLGLGGSVKCNPQNRELLLQLWK